MANHVRRQIRDAAAAALAGLVTTGSRVYPSRTKVMQDAHLPGLRVYTDEEDIEISSLGVSRLLERQLTLVVEAVAKVNDTLDDTLDQIIQEVEVALAPGLTGAKWVTLTRVEIEMNDEGEKDTGIARMQFSAPYITSHDAPDVAL
jgi:hypothetical protein